MNSPTAPYPLPATVPQPPDVPRFLGDLAIPPALTSKPQAWDLVKSLGRRWRIALLLGLFLSAVTGGLVWLIVPNAKYTAVATLHVATFPRRIMFEPHEREPDYRTYQRTQVALIKNRKILADALDKVGPVPTVVNEVDPEDWLDKHLKVDFPGGAEVLQISLSGDIPEDLTKIVNAVVKSYMTLVVDEEEGARVKRLDSLQKLRARYDEALRNKRKTLKQTATAVGLSDQKALAEAQQFRSELLGQVQRERMAAHSELLKLKAELSVVEARRNSEPASAAPERPEASPIDVRVERDPRVQEQREYVAELTRKYEAVSRLTTRQRNDPALVRKRKDLESARKGLDEIRAAVAADLASRGDGEGGGDGLPLSERIKGRISILETYVVALDKDIERLRNDVKVVNEGSIDLENEREELAILAAVARQVGTEVEAVQVELGAPARVRLLSDAKIPPAKNDYRKTGAGVATALGVFGFALLGVAFWEFQARRIGTVDELVRGLGIRLVGTIPDINNRPRPRVPSGEGSSGKSSRSQLAESVDAMRALLLHTSREEMIRAVMITSAIKGEGKTSLAGHLACSLVRSGRRTLLVDCDLRRPACHRVFEMPLGPGLCEFLRGEVELGEVIHQAPVAGLSLIPVGRCDEQALRALASLNLRDLFGELKSLFDFVVVDSAPILPVADSLIVAQAADAVIFSVLRMQSRLPLVYAAHQRLSALGVRMLGAVVAGVRHNEHYYDYPYSNV